MNAYHFEDVMRQYERFSAAIRRIGMFRYSDDPNVQRAEVLPTPSDFICDVDLTCTRALSGHPRLLALWRGIYVDERFSEKKVAARLPDEFQQLAELCGAALRRVIPNVRYYFDVTLKQRAEVQKELKEFQAALEAFRNTPEARNAAARKARNAARRRRYRELKRNKRRREKYAERKVAEAQNEQIAA